MNIRPDDQASDLKNQLKEEQRRSKRLEQQVCFGEKCSSNFGMI